MNSVQYYCYDDGAALKILSKVYETKTPSPNWDNIIIYAHGPNYDYGNKIPPLIIIKNNTT